LLEAPPGGQRSAAIEDADVVESEEPALEGIAAGQILAVEAPREVVREPVEGEAQEIAVGGAAAILLEAMERQGGPGVHGRIDVAEIPLVRRQPAARMHVDVPHHEEELLLGEVEVDERERQGV